MASINLKNIYLDYPLIGLGSRSLKNTLIGAATGGLISSGDKVPVIKALSDISFSLKDGDRLGLLGHNGAGKSTLLKLIAGIYSPTNGSIAIEGKIVSTLNVSLGMEMEATGIENIITRGLLMGMSRVEIREKIDEIVQFTELGDYLNMPVRIYSSGMITRLAFATITSMDSDIVLMDEVIGTGDASFMEKAEQRLGRFINKSKIIVLASHSEDIIKRFCNVALVLEHGSILTFGPIDEVLNYYKERSAVHM